MSEFEKCRESESLQMQINHVKEDVEDLKEYKKLYMENNMALVRNVERLTTLAEKQDERMERQDKRMENQERKIEAIQKKNSDEITGLRQEIQKSNELNITWYQKFIGSTFGKIFKYMLIIILILLGVKIAGADILKFL
ncbi:hypothetical protein [Halalkalibacter oceani]|uniref:hypothetical protein n=1 Tax=Halalkalibacter oceani TaxID=1653776 RepID=UPI0033980286